SRRPNGQTLNSAVECAQSSWRYTFYASDLPSRIDKLPPLVDAFAHAFTFSPHFSNEVAHRASESGKRCFVRTTCADSERPPDADGV
ncbi:MAG TPA: hypothetical protein VMS87_10035, partial [Roseiarcus sp.]|nr:hypothetical protein [Roseiarcus sp.]